MGTRSCCVAPAHSSWVGRPSIVPLFAQVSDRAPNAILTVGLLKGPVSLGQELRGVPCQVCAVGRT